MTSLELINMYFEKGYLTHQYIKFEDDLFTCQNHIPNDSSVILMKYYKDTLIKQGSEYFPFITSDNVYIII